MHLDDKTIKKLETLNTTLAECKGTNLRKANAVRNRLLKLAHEHPREAAHLGISANGYQQSRVFQYGVLLSDLGHAGDAQHAARLRHEYYNALVAMAKPFAESHNALLRGKAGKKLEAIRIQIETAYSQIRGINLRARAKVRSDEVTDLLDDIKLLKASRAPLWAEAAKERSTLYKQHKDEISAIDEAMAQGIRAIRTEYGPKGLGLWHGNYLMVERQFQLAWKKAREGERMHLRYERGGKAPKVSTWAAWDGAGSVSISLSQKEVPKDVSSIFTGNPRLRITALDMQTWLSMGGRSNFYIKPNLRLALVRIGTDADRNPVWARAVIVLHRELPADANVTEASIVRVRVGNRWIERLNISLKSEPKPAATSGRKVSFHFGNFAPVVLHWTDDAGGHGEMALDASISSSMAEVRRLQSYLDTYTAETKKYVNTLDVNHFPTLSAEGLHVGTGKGLHRYYDVWRRTINRVGMVKQMEQMSRSLIKSGTESTRNEIAKLVQANLGLDSKQSKLFAALLVFDERYRHLLPWATNLRQKMLRKRKDQYRVFAASFAGAQTFLLPADDLRSRSPSEEKLLASPSELVTALEQFARREGVSIEWVKKTKAAAA